MRIDRIGTTILRAPGAEVYDATHKLGERALLIVSVTSADGIIGTGEAESWGQPEIVASIIERKLAPLLTGADASDPEALWHYLLARAAPGAHKGYGLAAISGIDIALWDLSAKYDGSPLYRHLGAEERSVEAYASGGFYAIGKDTIALAEEAASYVRAGFRGVKIKVARNPSPDRPERPAEVDIAEDLRRVRAVCAAVGPEIKVMVDANRSWSMERVMEIGQELEELGVAFLEEPVSPEDFEGSAQLASKLDLPIAGYESQTDYHNLERIVDMRAVDIIQADAIRSGGITALLRLGRRAAAMGIPFMPHNFSSVLSLAANLHALLVMPNPGAMEIPMLTTKFHTGIARVGPLIADGRVSAPDAPGLGVELEEGLASL